MEQPANKTVKAAVIIGSLILIALFVVWLVFNVMLFRITGTNPSTSRVSNIAPFFKVQFTKNLSSERLSVSASDPSIIRKTQVDGKTLIINLNQLQLKKTYTVHLNHIQATSGDAIKNKMFTFTTVDIPYNNLPKDQQQGVINNQSYFTTGQNDPILAYLPASSLHYTITAMFGGDSSTKSSLVLDTKILLSNADAGTGENDTIKAYEQEATDYIKGLGFDPSKYTFQFTVVSPS